MKTEILPAVEGEKILLLIRHAKSGWEVASSDFERPLNERGKRDAPLMAARLKDRNIAVDAFVSSPAKRAKKTAEYFIETFNGDKEDIIFITKLYHAGCDIFYEAVQELDDKFSAVALFSHNPGITDFVNSLAGSVRIDNMPTCGIFAVRIKTSSWKNFKTAEKEFLFFDYPKNS